MGSSLAWDAGPFGTTEIISITVTVAVGSS